MKKEKRKNKVVKTLLNIILVLCLGGAVFFGGKYFYDIYTQENNAKAALVKADDAIKTKKDIRKKKINIGEVIGKFSVNGLIDSTPIIEGEDLYLAMNHGIGHVESTRLPGDGKGIIALSAHRETFFKPLKDMKNGDIVEIEMPYGTYKYKVVKHIIVKPNEGNKIYNENGLDTERLALITCYPFSAFAPPNERIVFFADLIEKE